VGLGSFPEDQFDEAALFEFLALTKQELRSMLVRIPTAVDESRSLFARPAYVDCFHA